MVRVEPATRRRQGERSDEPEESEPPPPLPDRRPSRSLLRRPALAILAALLLGLVLLVPIGALSVTGTGQQAGAARQAAPGTGHITHAIELSAATTPTAWGWGNDPGNSTSNNKSPVKATTGSKASNLPPGATVTQVAAGSNGSAMALTSDGYVYAWGNNQYGQAGYPTTGEGGADVYYSPLKIVRAGDGHRHRHGRRLRHGVERASAISTRGGTRPTVSSATARSPGTTPAPSRSS